MGANGGRVEIGPVHLGLAGHYGVGLGLDFAFQPGAATAGNPDQNYELRTFDGYYAQLQVVLGQIDLAAGVGMTRVHLLDSDPVDSWIDDDGDTTTPTLNDDANPAQNDPVGYNNYKQQMGVSAGVVYHATDYIHVSLDVFRAQHEWYLGDRKQTLYFVNLGPTVDW